MKITRLVQNILIRLFLIATLVPLQSCSNTLIGEKLENSFDITEKPKASRNTIKAKEQNKIKKIKLSKKNDQEENKNESDTTKLIKENIMSNKNRFSKNSTKSVKKVIFNPQPYRIILKLSAANPSAPAETVTKALRKAGVEFEVEKIERFDEKILLKDSSLRKKNFDFR